MPDISKEPVISVSDIPHKHTRGFCKYSRRCLPPQGSMLHSSAPKAVPRSRELPALLYVLMSFYSSDASRSPYGVICIHLPPRPEEGVWWGLLAKPCGYRGGCEEQHCGMESRCFSGCCCSLQECSGATLPEPLPRESVVVPLQTHCPKTFAGYC